jgi:hypothetical protein
MTAADSSVGAMFLVSDELRDESAGQFTLLEDAVEATPDVDPDSDAIRARTLGKWEMRTKVRTPGSFGTAKPNAHAWAATPAERTSR